MTPIIINAGPALSFLASGDQDLLCAAVELRGLFGEGQFVEQGFRFDAYVEAVAGKVS